MPTLTTPRCLLEAALAAAKTTQASAVTTIKLIETQLASLDQDTEIGTKVYTLEQAAERRNLSANTLRTWARSGRLACRRGPREAYLTTDTAIDAALGIAAAAVRTGPTLELVEDANFDPFADAFKSGQLVRTK